MGVLDAGLTYDARRANPRTMSESDLYELCVTAGWRAKDGEDSPQYAVGVIMAESGGRTDVTSSNPAGGNNTGLFQIWSGNVLHPEFLKDSVYNANVARRMFVLDGKTFKIHWETAAKGKVDPSKLHGPSDEAVPAGPLPQGWEDTLTGTLKILANAIHTLQSAEFWQRTGKIVLGGVLLILASLFFFGEMREKLPVPKVSL